VAVIVQMIRIQNSDQAKLFIVQGDRYAGEFTMIYPERGEIYDRNGHLLAGNRTVYEVGVSLTDLRDPEAMATALSSHLGLPYDEVYSRLTNSPEGWQYVVVQDYVSVDQVTSLQQLLRQLEESEDYRLRGLAFKPHFQRSYPESTLASNLLGFVTRDGRGYFGIEEKYNDLLAGNPVQVWIPRDPNKAIEIPRVPNGTNLVLTLNRDLQAKVESILDQSLSEYGAENGTIIVMDPRNGELLAMATTPRLNLNNYSDYFQLYDAGTQFLCGYWGHSSRRYHDPELEPGCVGPAEYDRLFAAFAKCVPGLDLHPDGAAGILRIHGTLRDRTPNRNRSGRRNNGPAQGPG
jgi:cell division protein FtsI/penicillin-binding protein 2